jgi:hypothetical protein
MAKRNFVRHIFVPIAVIFWIFGWFLSFVGEKKSVKSKQANLLTKHIAIIQA